MFRSVWAAALVVGLMACAFVLPRASASTVTDGVRTDRVLVILVTWTKPDAVTQASATRTVFGDVNAWFKEVSGGRYRITGKVTPWIRIPAFTGDCFENKWLIAKASNEATRLGYYNARPDHVIYYFPRCSSTTVNALTSIDAHNIWLNGKMTVRTTVHELGHSRGLRHASSLRCTRNGARVTLTAGATGCIRTDRGDPYDVMGSSRGAGHYQAGAKNRLGMLAAGQARFSRVNDDAVLTPLETASGLKLLVVRAADGVSYTLENRAARGYDTSLPWAGFGVLVRRVTSAGPALLDMKPATEAFDALTNGQRWTSPEGLRLTVSTTAGGMRVIVANSLGLPRAPGTPTGIETNTVRLGTLLVGWRAPADNGLPIDVSEVVVTNDLGTPAIRVTAKWGSASIAGLYVGTTYQVWVRAHNAVGWGPWSSPVPVTMSGDLPIVESVTASTTPGFADVRIANVGDWDCRWAFDGVMVFGSAVSDGVDLVITLDLRGWPEGPHELHLLWRSSMTNMDFVERAPTYLTLPLPDPA